MTSRVRVCALVAALSTPRALGAAEASRPELYVSETFKTAARHVLKQVVAQTLAGACKPEQPLCASIVEQVAEAAEAALSRNDARLRAALYDLFVGSSIDGVLHLVIGDLLQSDNVVKRLWSTRYAKKRSDLAPIFRLLTRCVSAQLTGNHALRKCQPSADELAEVQRIAGGLEESEKKGLEGLQREMRLGRVRPETAFDAFTSLVVARDLDLYDLQYYLQSFRPFFRVGFDGGLFEPILAFVTSSHLGKDDSTEDVRNLVAALLGAPAAPGSQLAVSSGVDPSRDEYRAALVACKADLEAYDAWVKLRDGAGGASVYVDRLRRAVLVGDDVDLAPLERLVTYECDPSTNADAAEKVRALKRLTRSLLAAVKLRSMLTRYVTSALAAAAVVDFIRSGDEKTLDRALRDTILAGLGAEALRVRTARALAATGPGDAMAALATPRAGDAFCDVRPFLDAFRDTALAHSTRCGAPEQPARVDDSKAAAFQEVANRLRGERPPALDPPPPGLDELVRAAVLFVEEHPTAARKTVARLGIEALVDNVLGEAMSAVGEGTTCDLQSRASSFFSPMKAECAARGLIDAAYRPVAELLWENGLGDTSAPRLARDVQESAARSPILAGAPVILNVGLGASYVRSSAKRRLLGDSGYAGLTVLDKYGVAFWKLRSNHWSIETGPFVGGFLDALVRTAARAGESRRVWFAGYTVGVPRMGGVDVGIEVHLAAALPYDLPARADAYGLAFGGSLVLPIAEMLGDE